MGEETGLEERRRKGQSWKHKTENERQRMNREPHLQEAGEQLGKANDSGTHLDVAAYGSRRQLSGLHSCRKAHLPGRVSAEHKDCGGFHRGPLKVTAGLQTGPDSTDPETTMKVFKDQVNTRYQKTEHL